MLRLVILLMALVVLAKNQNNEVSENMLKVGNSMNSFDHYGFMSFTMQVMPEVKSCSQYTGSFFCEPTVDIFKDSNMDTMQMGNSDLSGSSEFQMEFCNDTQELTQSYFRDFNFEKYQHMWKLFAGAEFDKWNAVSHFEINPRYASEKYCYVLLRLINFRDGSRLMQTPKFEDLQDEVARELEKVQLGNETSVIRFIKKYGTHYIESFATGDSLYQVVVQRRHTCDLVKEAIKEENINVTKLSYLLSPYHAQQVGNIRSSSGNEKLEWWASLNLRLQYKIFVYYNLWQIVENAQLFDMISELLQNEALLSINLKSLSVLFKNSTKRRAFEEIVNNRANLWESNL